MPVPKVELRDWHFFIFCHNKISIIPLNYFRISLQFIRSDKTNSLIIKFKNCTHRTPKTEYNGVNTLFYGSLRCSMTAGIA